MISVQDFLLDEYIVYPGDDDAGCTIVHTNCVQDMRNFCMQDQIIISRSYGYLQCYIQRVPPSSIFVRRAYFFFAMFKSLTTKANAVLTKEFAVNDLVCTWTVPREASHGDASTSIALQVASKQKKNPREVAAKLCDALKKLPEVEKAEVAGAGYVNVWLTSEAILAELTDTEDAQTPSATRKAEQPVIVEYSAPNIAKPFGIHHILTTIIGQALANLYRHLGYPTVAINHIGDWGTQFGKLSVAMQRWGKGKTPKDLGLDGLLSLYVRFHEEAEATPALEDEARAAFKKLEDGDAEMRTFWKDVVAVTMQTLDGTYRRLNVAFDEVQGESFYEDKMQMIIDEGKKKKVFVEGEGGALIVEFPEESKLPPYMVLKGDGATLYSTRDLATIRYRVDRWQPESLLYVVDVAQQLYFQQLFATVKMLGWKLPHLEHVYFGRMSFTDKKMSTRKGNILKLDDVLEEAVKQAEKVIDEHRETIQTDDADELAEMMGIGSVVYGILSQNRKMDIVFDWDKMLSFEGNSAPYLQYTHARARSVLRKAGADKKRPSFPAAIQSLTEKERVLIRALLQFPSVLEDARENHMPHKLATFLYGLCQDFNAFYNVDPILTSEGETRELRIALTAFSANVLKVGAEILTLRVPERM